MLKKIHAHARQLTPVLFSPAAVVLVSLEDTRVEGVDATGVVLACLADGRNPALQLIHILKNIQWYPSLETTLMRNHHEKRHPEERQPRGKTTRRDHPEERPPV